MTGADRRLWAAITLAHGLDTCRSLLRGLPVRAGNLDGFVLQRALRGEPLPDAESFVRVTVDMLDAVAEAGPIPTERGR